MRIFTLALLAGSAIAATGSLAQNEAASVAVVETAVNLSADTPEPAIDMIVTGQTIDPENMKKWEERKRAYIECPTCASQQAFPE
jgi:hypothetical protein